MSRVCALCGARYPGDALFCPVDGAPLQSAGSPTHDGDDPYVGQELPGHIEIQALVGVGAMGRVYRAFQKGIDRDVAVKILHRELSANAQLVSRFTREAKVASRLSHPNVVQVLLAGQLTDRALYMVMEYLDGLSLQSALAAAGGVLPLPRALHIVLQLCDAAGEAHAQGIVHRDLKPENVMLVRRGGDADFVKVLDFGIARINWGEQSMATAAGLIFGTARYISPEGAQGHTVGPASDVYSIATLLFQMLSGRTPFEGEQAVALLVQQIHDKPPSLKDIPRASFVPAAIADVVMANLAKDPGDREPDARALGHAIVDAMHRAGLSPDEITGSTFRRKSNVMKMAPETRTNGTHIGTHPGSNGDGRPPSGATVKWEPPSEFQARLAAAVGTAPRPVVPPPSSRPRMQSGVDETLDDASAEPPVVVPQASFSAASPRTAPPQTAPGEQQLYPASDLPALWPRPTEYTPPVPETRVPADSSPETPRKKRKRRSSGALIALFALCLVLGAAVTAIAAWKMGRLGGESDEDSFVTRANDAMFKSRFAEPPGENVRDITDEGLRRWPGDARLIDVRVRAAIELANRALAQRAAGDIAEALRLARLARDLDPSDPSRKKLVEQYEAELATFATTPPPLTAATASSGATAKPQSPPAPVPIPQATSYKVLLDVSQAQPRPGDRVELRARVAPSKGNFEKATFTIQGPGLNVAPQAQSSSTGVFQTLAGFPQAGKYEVVFTVLADGKPLRAVRMIQVGEPAAPSPPPTPVPPPPAPTGTVKWM